MCKLVATDKSLDERMADLDDVVRKASERFHKGPSLARDHATPVEYRNPVDELAEREDEAERDSAFTAIEMLLAEGADLPLLFQEKVKEAAQRAAIDQFRQYEEMFMEWLFAAGPHPLEVLRRLFGYAKMKRASLLWNMGFREVGPLLGETHASAALRCKALFGETPAGWKKKEEARRKMKEAALGNMNRNGLTKLHRKQGGSPKKNGHSAA